jgi:tetratricopeptide (TPR) repeat protein
MSQHELEPLETNFDALSTDQLNMLRRYQDRLEVGQFRRPAERRKPHARPKTPGSLKTAIPARFKLTLAWVAAGTAALMFGALWLWDRSVQPQRLVESGVAMLGEARLDEAIAASREAIRLRPNYVEAHVNLGIALDRQGNVADAVPVLRRATQLDVEYAPAHAALADALARLGRLDEAIATYRIATRLNPADARAAYRLGKVLAKQGKFEQAIAAYKAALKGQPPMEIIYYDLIDLERAQANATGGIAKQ